MPLSPADIAQVRSIVAADLLAAQIKISALPPINSIPRTGVLPIVANGSTQKISVDQLLALGATVVQVGQDLRAMVSSTLSDGAAFFTLGVVTANDGGGGLWRYDANSVATDNIGTVIAPDDGVGRFLRIFSGTVFVRWFGEDIVAAQRAADLLAAQGGGNMSFDGGIFNLTDRLLITSDNVTIFVEPNTTLNLSGWMYPGSQTPFGNQIHFTGKNGAIFGGNRTTSILQISGGSQANAVGMLNRSNFQVLNLTIDGDKDNVTAIADDTFQSAVSFVNSSSQNPDSTSQGRLVINNCELRNFVQYGVNLYGDLATYITITNTIIHGHGRVGVALSVGVGISISHGVKNLVVGDDCLIYGNKRHGIDCCSAGEAINTIKIGGIIKSNGEAGVVIHEESNFSSVANVGQNGILFEGAQIYENGTDGIRIGTYDNVGVIINWSISGDCIIRDNGRYGVLLQSNAPGGGQVVAMGKVDGVIRGNASGGVALDTNIRNVIVRGGLIINNTGFDIQDTSGLNDVNINHTISGEQFYHAYDFAPTLIGTSTPGVGTYTEAFGKAVKIGNRVFFQIVLTWTAHTGTGDMRIVGLPVAAIKQNALAVFCSDLAAGVTDLRARTADASTQVFLANFDAGNITGVPIEVAGNIIIGGHYDITP